MAKRTRTKRTRTKRKRTKRTRTKRTKGGVLFTETQGQDIMPELMRFSNGKVDVVNRGRYGLILRLTADASPILTNNTCEISNLLVKIVAIDEDAKYGKQNFEKISVENFKKEVSLQQEICEKSIEKFNCSIAPTLLYAEIYTHVELMGLFPKIGSIITTTGRIGVIFMEMIKADNDDYPAFTVLDYYKMPKNNKYIINYLFPMARRLLIMLAQLGFLHNDFHLGNILVQETRQYATPSMHIIDFGRTSRINEEQIALFNSYVEANDLEKMIPFLFGEIIGYMDDNPTFLGYLWLKQDQIEYDGRVITPGLLIEPEKGVTTPLELKKDKKLCVQTRIPYVDREGAAAAPPPAAPAPPAAASAPPSPPAAAPAETPAEMEARLVMEAMKAEGIEW